MINERVMDNKSNYYDLIFENNILLLKSVHEHKTRWFCSLKKNVLDQCDSNASRFE